LILSTTACGILFGVEFWTVARSVDTKSPVRRHMLHAAYGISLFFTAAAAGILQAGYPPFGLASVCGVALSSFLIFRGLCNICSE